MNVATSDTCVCFSWNVATFDLDSRRKDIYVLVGPVAPVIFTFKLLPHDREIDGHWVYCLVYFECINAIFVISFDHFFSIFCVYREQNMFWDFSIFWVYILKIHSKVTHFLISSFFYRCSDILQIYWKNQKHQKQKKPKIHWPYTDILFRPKKKVFHVKKSYTNKIQHCVLCVFRYIIQYTKNMKFNQKHTLTRYKHAIFYIFFRH